MAKKIMATRSQRNKGDRDEDVAAPAINSDVLSSFVTAVTQAMMTAIANTMVPLPVTPKTITYSSVIDLYNNESLQTKKKEGKYMWNLTTDSSKGWKKGWYFHHRQAC